MGIVTSADDPLCQTFSSDQAARLLGVSDSYLLARLHQDPYINLKVLTVTVADEPKKDKAGRRIITKASVYALGEYQATLNAATPLNLGVRLPINLVATLLGLGELSAIRLLADTNIVAEKDSHLTRPKILTSSLERLLGAKLQLWPDVPEVKASFKRPTRQPSAHSYDAIKARVDELETMVLSQGETIEGFENRVSALLHRTSTLEGRVKDLESKYSQLTGDLGSSLVLRQGQRPG